MYLEKADFGEFPSKLTNLIEAELENQEKPQWVGRPNPRRFALRSIPILLFAIPWTAFSLFWMAGAAGFEVPDFKDGFDLFPLFGLPFLLVGFVMLGSPMFMIYRAKNTAYVLTSTRAIIFDGGLTTTVRSFDATRLRDLRRKQRDDGTGDLIFERRFSNDGDGAMQTTDYGFLAISDVKEVEGMVRNLVDRAASDRA